jgi:hypothetical protein
MPPSARSGRASTTEKIHFRRAEKRSAFRQSLPIGTAPDNGLTGIPSGSKKRGSNGQRIALRFSALSCYSIFEIIRKHKIAMRQRTWPFDVNEPRWHYARGP